MFSADRESVLDIDAAIKWAIAFAPDATIHVTGGEPFVLPGMVESIRKIIYSGFRVAVFTNGSLLRKYESEGIYDLPVAWQICHHPSQISVEDFLYNVEPLKNKPHLLCRIAGKVTRPTHELASLYSGYNFRWIENMAGFVDYESSTAWNKCPSKEMLLIGVKGDVFPCSKPFTKLGHVEAMTFDRAKANRLGCHAKKYPSKCQACQSTELLEGLLNGM